MFHKVFILFSFLILSGCSMRPEFKPVEPGDEAYAPPKIDSSQSPASGGSLYRKEYMLSLFQDRRAYRVGDILEITLEEETQAEKNADTQFDKNAGVRLNTPTLGNLNTADWNAQLDVERDFNGSGQSSQNNSLTGSITVSVYEVLPNGVLKVRCEKWLELNQGEEYIRLRGLVRPDDINKNNQVSSQKIADARITYAGKGAIADSNAAGWLVQFFNSPWMPF